MEKILLYIIGASALCAASSIRYRQYRFIYDPRNWTEAQTYCRQTYTDLVTVDSYSTVTTLNRLADVTQMGSTTDAWIGLSFDVVSWKWSLAEGSYTNSWTNFWYWSSGEPSSLWYEAQCTRMYDSGLWDDIPCEWLSKPICSNVSGQAVTFVFVDKLMTWPDAQSYCREQYTDLASIRDLSENENIRALKPAGLIVWIGLYRDTWKWSNGPMYVYRYWAGGQPSSGLQKCAAANFGSSGLWMGWTCDVKKAFVCYHDPVPLWRTVIKVKLVKTSSLDLQDPVVLKGLLEQFKQKLMNQNVQLSWKNRPNGDVFYQDKTRT